MGSRLLFAAVLLSGLPGAPLGGQQPPQLRLGDRVRVRLRPDILIAIPTVPARFTALWEGTAGDSFVVRRPAFEDGRLAVPAVWVTHLDISRGRRTSALAGAVIGGLAGTVLGVMAVAGHCECTAYPGIPLHAPMLALFGLGGGLLGSGIGVTVGSTIRSERWEELRW